MSNVRAEEVAGERPAILPCCNLPARGKEVLRDTGASRRPIRSVRTTNAKKKPIESELMATARS